jgi:hypothetical protein
MFRHSFSPLRRRRAAIWPDYLRRCPPSKYKGCPERWRTLNPARSLMRAMEVPFKDYLITPGAREDTLGRWMPVLSVRRPPKDRFGNGWAWPSRTVVAERHKTRDEAERRAAELAKQMITAGDFKSSRRPNLSGETVRYRTTAAASHTIVSEAASPSAKRMMASGCLHMSFHVQGGLPRAAWSWAARVG